MGGKDILSMYGPDFLSDKLPGAKNGGDMPVKPIPYSPPKGPSNINDSKSPGLHGSNCGNCGTQGRH